MAVVINDFEVVPAEPARERAASTATDQRSANEPADRDREIEKKLRVAHARAARRMAV